MSMRTNTEKSATSRRALSRRCHNLFQRSTKNATYVALRKYVYMTSIAKKKRWPKWELQDRSSQTHSSHASYICLAGHKLAPRRCMHLRQVKQKHDVSGDTKTYRFDASRTRKTVQTTENPDRYSPTDHTSARPSSVPTQYIGLQQGARQHVTLSTGRPRSNTRERRSPRSNNTESQT